jgi:hypothetical protein
MTHQRRLNTLKAPTSASSLWIVALFAALGAVVAGLAAIATDGTTRLMFGVFAVGFPIAILVAFIWLVLNHPWQYATETNAPSYKAAVRRENQDTTAVLLQAVSEAVASAVVYTNPAPPSAAGERETIESVRERVASTFEDALAAHTITVHLTLLGDDAEPLHFPIRQHTTVQNLLDSVWIALDPAVEPYSYTKSWILEREDGKMLDKIGAGTERADSRRLDTVGIHPGSTLRAVRASGRSK